MTSGVTRTEREPTEELREQKSVLQKIDNVIVFIAFVMRLLSGAIIVGTMLITVYDVVMRYFFAQPTTWALTLSAAGVLAATFFAIPHIAAVDEHIEMDLVYRKLGQTAQRIADVVRGVATLAFGIGMAWLAYRAAMTAYVNGSLTSGNFNIPIWTLYAMVYLGGVGLAVVLLLEPWRSREVVHGDTAPVDTREGAA